jgi:hypothetical protein
MGLFDTLSNMVYGKKRPVYQPTPAAVTPQAAPAYRQNAQAGAVGGRLQGVLEGQLSAAPAQRSITTMPVAGTALPTMPQSVRDAILGGATRSANYTADQSSSRLSETLNQMNLLGSTAQGRGLGEIERARQDQIGNARDQVTAQEFQFQNSERDRQLRERDQQLNEQGQINSQQQNVYDNASRLLAILQNQDQYENSYAMQGAQFGANEATRTANEGYRAYESKAAQTEDQANRNQNLLQTILGGYYLLG